MVANLLDKIHDFRGSNTKDEIVLESWAAHAGSCQTVKEFEEAIFVIETLRHLDIVSFAPHL